MWIDGYIANANFVVKVRASAVSAGSNKANHVAALDILPGRNREPGKMRIERFNPVPMVNYDFSPVTVAHLRLHDGAIGSGSNGISSNCGNVNSSMEGTFAIVEGIFPFAERTGHSSLHGPERRSV